MFEEQKKITIEDLISKFKEYNNNEEEIDLINKAYEYANRKHFGVKRITGDDYITHPLNVAMILTDINADSACLTAALLHDTIEDTDSTKEEITKLFGSEVALLVDGVTKINRLHFSNAGEQMAANQRKILVGLSEDVRVIIIKLADRLHNMRTLYVMPEEKQKKKARETLEILTPVADRLGINKIKSELEDLSLRYLKPDVYFDIVEKLNAKKTEMDDDVNKMLEEVSSLLNEHHIKHEIFGRSKSIYSIYKKLDKGKRFNDIYDILALRALVDTEQECYLALGLIHSKYKPVPNRFKDYIAMPKTNLYQSLHTTVFGVDGKLFEIQIRTHEMHKVAEYGIASHWSYKAHGSVKTVKDSMEEKLQIFRSIMELNEDSDTPEEFINNIKQDVLPNDSIYVYTPKGDVIELPVDSTPVDFAYKVHSEVGNTLVGAIVNENIVPLDFHLKTGDIIKVNTSKASRGPNKDWLNFVVTSHARNKIKSFYSKIDKNETLSRGQELFTNELRKNNLPINETLNSQELEKVLEELKLKNVNELYIDIGSNKFTAQSVIKLLIKKDQTEDITTKINESTNRPINTKNDILVEGLGDVKVNLSGCCKPIPGDNIVGYITKGSGITVHRTICQNITNIDERLITVKWNQSLTKKYFTDIIIYTNTSDNLLDIITKASLNSITIDSISTINKSDYKVYKLTILVENVEKLNKFIIDLSNLPFTLKVDRILK
ncbi:MAG: bifunctional (p)ppGpp synthetase/guanosine-3',5'-bis(diphosphate) 3'-pyrophosphohydrolase [Erysipelotrichaceae bacterium]|nr:bifunctional (p)ppGpp synthetase/guanosine-3',5'-bis(diphosphate) 3'-pyrophosphohydrolase [Erysipelotrichaceae bacterium]